LALNDAKKLYIKDFIQELIELWTDLNYRDSFASQVIFGKRWTYAGLIKALFKNGPDQRMRLVIFKDIEHVPRTTPFVSFL